MGGITCTQAAVVDGNAAQPMAAHRGSCCCGRVCDHDRRISNVSFGISGTSDSSSTDKTQVVGPGQDHVAGEASARTYNSEGSSAVDPIAHASKRKSFYKDKPPAPKNQNARDRLRRLAKSGLLLKGIHLMLLAREFEEHLGCDDDMGDKRNEALAVPSPMDVQILSSGKPDKLSDGVSCPVKPQDGPVNPRHYRPDQSVHYWVEELHHHVIPSKQASFSKSALEKMLEKARVRWFGEDDQLSFHTAHRDPSGESTPTGNASWELGPSVAQAVPFAGTESEAEAREREAHWNMWMYMSQNRLRNFTFKDFESVYTYSYEIPEDDQPEAPDLQIYSTANSAMRLAFVSNDRADALKEVAIFRPFIYWLERALAKLPAHRAPFVYRGLKGRIDKNRMYRAGAEITWSSFSSTTHNRSITDQFSDAGGTCFLIQPTESYKISPFSAFPAEQESLLAPNTTFKVMNVISETHLQMIESKVDVIVLRQKSAAANDTIASLQFKLQSMRELSFVYKNLLERFVVPRGRPMPSSPEADEYNLGDWLLLQVKRAGTVILITGGAGTGKSVVGLWLIHKLIETQQAADERTARSARQAEAGAEAAAEEGPTKVAKALPMLPFFLSLPAAEGDVFREMGLIKLLKKQYGLTNAELLEMANNYFIVLVLDSFDEIAPGNFAAADSRNVLELNNLNFFPNMSVIVTARDDFPFPRTWLTAGRLHLVETNIVPFRQEHVEQYLHLCAKSEARNTKYTERRALLQRIVARDEMRMEEIQKEKARARHLGPEGTGELTTFQSIVEASMASARAELRNYPDVVPEDEARWRRTLKTDILRQWKNAVAQVLAMLHRACQTSCRLSTVNLFGLKAPPIPPGAHLKVHGLQAIVQNPFVLWMVLPCLKDIVARADRDKRRLPGFPILEYTIYEYSVEFFIHAALQTNEPELFPVQRGRGAPLNLLKAAQERTKEGMRLAMEVATRMSAKGLMEDTVGNYVDVDDPDPTQQQRVRLFKCLPLRLESYKNDSTFSFRHRTLMEFLIARYLWEDTDTALRQLAHALRKSDAMVLSFFGTKLQREETVCGAKYLAKVDLLMQIIRKSAQTTLREDALHASSAFSLLVSGMVSFSGMDLRGIRVPGAILTGALLNNAILVQATLTDCVLCNAILDGADVTGANFDGADVSESPPVPYDQPLSAAVFFPHEPGKVAIASGDEVFLRDLDAQGGDQCVEVGFTGKRVNCLCFSPTRPQFATGSEDTTVRLWDYSKDKAVSKATMIGHAKGVRSVCFSSCGDYLVSCSRDIIVWTLAGDQRYRMTVGTGMVNCVAFMRGRAPQSRNALMLASGGEDKFVRLWKDGKRLRGMKGHKEQVRAVAFAPDGETLVSGGDGKLIIIWTLAGVKLQVLRGHAKGIRSLSFCPVTKNLASGSDDRMVMIWNTAGKKLQALFFLHNPALKGHTHPVTCVSFNASGTQLVAASESGHARIWDVGEFVSSDKGHNGSVTGIAISRDDRFIASAGDDQSVRLWSQTGELLAAMDHPDRVNCVAFAAEDGEGGPVIVSGARDGVVRAWSIQGRLLQQYEGHIGSVRSVNVSVTGRWIISTAPGEKARVWERDAEVQCILDQSEETPCAVFSPDEGVIVGGSGRRVKMWGPMKGQVMLTLPGSHEADVTSVMFTPEGHTLTTCDGYSVMVWTSSGKALRTIRIAPAPAAAGPGSVEEEEEDDGDPDGEEADRAPIPIRCLATYTEQMFVVGTANGAITFYGMEGERPRREGRRESQTPDPVVVSGEDSVISVWEGHQEAVNSIVFSNNPRNRVMISASDDSTLRMSTVGWDPELGYRSTRADLARVFPASDRFCYTAMKGVDRLHYDPSLHEKGQEKRKKEYEKFHNLLLTEFDKERSHGHNSSNGRPTPPSLS